MPNVAARLRVLFLYGNRDRVTRNGYVHLALKMRDTRYIREYVLLIVTETQGDRGTQCDWDIEEQPAFVKMSITSKGLWAGFTERTINFNLCLMCSVLLSRIKKRYYQPMIEINWR